MNTQRVIFNTNIAMKTLDTDLIVINTNNGEYFRLNESAADMVNLLRKNLSVEETTQQLLAIYDIPREVLADDLTALIQELVDIGVAQVQPSAPQSIVEAKGGEKV